MANSASANKTTGKPKYLVTGTMGCIGAWVLRHLVNDGASIVATDLNTDVTRPALLLSEAEIASITWAQLDVTDGAAVLDMFAENEPTHLIHLAGLQIPFCKASPSLGASVNVVGTVNLLEAARQHNVRGVCYASSVGVYGAPELYPTGRLKHDALPLPNNLYGVYKTANENTAKVYWQDWQLGSIGLRPYTVFGIGRDQGLTADLAKATLAIAANEPFHIRFDGPVALQHAGDVARLFIDCAALEYQGAEVFNLRNDVLEVASYVDVLKQLYPSAAISYEKNNPLPFPANYDDSALQAVVNNVPHTALEDAIQADVNAFKQLLDTNRITTDCLKT